MIYEAGVEARMDEEIIIQSIINNMRTVNRIYYKIQLGDNFTFKKLINLIDLIEEDSRKEHYILNKKTESSEENKIYRLEEKINSLVNTFSDKKNYTNRKSIICKICNRFGHTEYDCRSQNFEKERNNNTSLKEDPFLDKIKRIENELNIRVTGTIEEFMKNLPKLPQTLEKLFFSFPNHYNIYPTLKRNDFF